MQNRQSTDLVLQALLMAVWRRKPTSKALVHSDQGSQFASIDWALFLKHHNLEHSMSRLGNCHDNAVAETINGLLKAEVTHRRGPWRSFEAVEYATLEWVDWLNTRRLLEPIGNIPPAEAEANFYAALETSDMAA